MSYFLQSVTDQAGIYAGEGGYDIEVGKNTDLKGAVIASKADESKNKLSTDTITYSDIENKAEYSASNKGVNVNTNKDAEYNEKGVTPNIGVKAQDDAKSTTKSAVSKGTIEVRSDKDKDLSGLSRDTEDALNKLGQIFDKKKVQEKQELAKVFGEEAFKEIHKISAKKGWKEGSPEKIALHALVGGIMADLGGGNALSGATAAGVNEAIQKQLNNIEDPGLHQIASALIGSAIGKIVGGDAQTGASVAASGTKNNNMLDSAQVKQLLYALKNAGSEEEKQQIMAQYIQESKPSSATNMGLTLEEESQLAEYLQNNYGVKWQSGNIEISLQEAIDVISGRPGTNIPVNEISRPNSKGDDTQTQSAMSNRGGIVPEQKTIEVMLDEGGTWNSSGEFVEANGTIRQDLPNRGDYEFGKGRIINGYYTDGTAAIKIDGKWYPVYTAPRKPSNNDENVGKEQSVVDKIAEFAKKDQENNKKFILNYEAGYQQSLIKKKELLDKYMPEEGYFPFSEEATIKNYNSNSVAFKLGDMGLMVDELLGMGIGSGKGYNAAYKMPPKMSGNNAIKGTSSKVKGFEENISKMQPGERVATVKTEAAKVAEQNGWVKDRTCSKMNDREVYKDPKTGEIYSVDTQHGRFEKCNSKGKHQGEVNFDLEQTKPADSSGKHDVRVK